MQPSIARANVQLDLRQQLANTSTTVYNARPQKKTVTTEHMELDGLQRFAVQGMPRQKDASLNSDFLTIYGLVMTLNANLLTSKSNQLICPGPKCS